MANFINKPLNAINVMRATIDHDVVINLWSRIKDRLYGPDFLSYYPPWSSDMRWISPRNLDDFRLFNDAFKDLGIEKYARQLIDFDERIILYSGFIVIRSVCEKEDFHLDWFGSENYAFTFLTPISDNPQNFGLSFEKLDGSIGTYDYKHNECIIFGSRFKHSTMVGRSDRPVILLSFTFGTDKMEFWPTIERTVGTQGDLFRRPDGSFVVRNFDAPKQSGSV